MVGALLDTSILIDILRLNSNANQWIAKQNIQFGVTGIVHLEVLQGAIDKQDQNNGLKLLRRFESIELTPSDYHWAIEQLIHYKLSHNVGGVDCLIAAPSHRLQIPLYTMNIKHFTPILGTLAQKPY
ncbi:MAG: PIN domain-containing protein [Chloroflexota bacterium]